MLKLLRGSVLDVYKYFLKYTDIKGRIELYVDGRINNKASIVKY